MFRYLVPPVIALILYLSVWATEAFPKEVKCPVCEQLFTVMVILSSNSAAGVDRDFCEHTWGTQTVVLQIAVCPQCHYSDFTDRLSENPQVSKVVRKTLQARQLKIPEFEALSPNEEGYSTSQIPAWVGYDLRAQIVKLDNPDDSQQQLTLMMSAAWSLRAQDNPFRPVMIELGYDDAIRQILNVIPVPRHANPSEERIGIARVLLAKLSELNPQDRPAAGAWAGYVLRGHGENSDLLVAAPDLARILADPRLAREIQATVERERGYLQRALDLMPALLAKPDLKERVNMVYLKGELCRRLGRKNEARASFHEALRCSPPRVIKDWIEDSLKNL